MTALVHPPAARTGAPALAWVLAVWVLGASLALMAERGGIAPRTEPDGLRVFLLEAGAVSRLAEHAAVRPGDRIQLAYDGVAAHGVIWSVDSRGVRSLHFPAHVGDSTALADGRAVPLPYSWELDDAPGEERFFFVTSRWPLDPARVMQRGAGRAAFTLRKATAAEVAAPSLARLR